MTPEEARKIIDLCYLARENLRGLPEPPRGVTGLYIRILEHIRSCQAGGRPVQVLEIARRAGTAPPGITRALNGMEQLGLIERARDADDRRYVQVEITDAGQRILHRYVDTFYAALSQRLPDLTDSQVEDMETVLLRTSEALGAIRRDLETALRSSGRFVLSGDPDACDYILKGEYREMRDGSRVTHQLALRLHDTAADLDVWTGSDEIAKE